MPRQRTLSQPRRYHDSRAACPRPGGGRGANKITGWRNSIPGALRIANWTLRSGTKFTTGLRQLRDDSRHVAPEPAGSLRAPAQVGRCSRGVLNRSFSLLTAEVSSYQLELWEVFSRTNRKSSHAKQSARNLDYICYNTVRIALVATNAKT